jgi:hypothetical protein
LTPGQGLAAQLCECRAGLAAAEQGGRLTLKISNIKAGIGTTGKLVGGEQIGVDHQRFF